MSKSLPLLCVALLTSSLIAQTIPQGFANKEGGRSRHVPLMYQPARIQCAYDAFGTGWLAPKVITSLWVRHDTTAPQSLQAAFKTDLQVWLSSDGVDTRLSSNMFIPNHGKDMVLFMKRKTYNFAPFAASPLKPAKFNIELKGDRPFVAVKRTFLELANRRLFYRRHDPAIQWWPGQLCLSWHGLQSNELQSHDDCCKRECRTSLHPNRQYAKQG